MQAFSAIGQLNLDGAGNVMMTEFVWQNGAIHQFNSTGTYTLGANCTVQFSFPSGTVVSGGGTFVSPSSFNGLLVSNTGGGILTLAPFDSQFLTGTIFTVAPTPPLP